MTELAKEAQRAFDSRDVWYKVNVQESVFKEGYIAGAKAREKSSTELEWQFKEVVKDNDYYQAENKRLEEENELLKKELEITRKNWQEQKNISLDTNCLLFKAKEIIKRLMNKLVVSNIPYDDVKELVDEVEKFLQE